MSTEPKSDPLSNVMIDIDTELSPIKSTFDFSYGSIWFSPGIERLVSERSSKFIQFVTKRIKSHCTGDWGHSIGSSDNARGIERSSELSDCDWNNIAIKNYMGEETRYPKYKIVTSTYPIDESQEFMWIQTTLNLSEVTTRIFIGYEH
jgi:hypothetical protein